MNFEGAGNIVRILIFFFKVNATMLTALVNMKKTSRRMSCEGVRQPHR